MEGSPVQLNEFTCSVAAGVLFSAGWWWFVDGMIISGSDTFGFQMWLPGIFATLGLLGVNMTNPRDLREDGLGDDPDLQKAKMFFFASWLFLFGALVAAVWICIADFGGDSVSRTSTYPGIAIILQSVLITLSTVVLWMGRGLSESVGF